MNEEDSDDGLTLPAIRQPLQVITVVCRERFRVAGPRQWYSSSHTRQSRKSERSG